jgi:hypothetical protein
MSLITVILASSYDVPVAWYAEHVDPVLLLVEEASARPKADSIF